MIKSDLVRRVAGKNPHLHAKDAERIVNAVLDVIGAALARRDRVETRGFGVFTVRLQSARPGRNPKNGAAVSVFRRNSILTFGHQKPCTVGSIERRDHEGSEPRSGDCFPIDQRIWRCLFWLGSRASRIFAESSKQG